MAVLPPVTAYALDRAKVTLPADFAAPLNLLILSFQRDQQSVVEGWLPVLTPGLQGANLGAADSRSGKRSVPVVVERLLARKFAAVPAAAVYGSVVRE